MGAPYELGQTDELAMAEAFATIGQAFSLSDTQRCATPDPLTREAVAELSPREQVDILTGILPVHPQTRFLLATAAMEPAIERRLAAMEYRMFLKTPYWAAVGALVLYRQPTCQLCGSMHKRNVHHKTYSHRGSEWRHLEDLAVVCEDCHKTVHLEAAARKQLLA
jgi:hypothetical protein